MKDEVTNEVELIDRPRPMKVSRKGMKRTTKLNRVVLKPARKGANTRGTCTHKRTRGARPTTPANMLLTGYAPSPVTAYTMDLAKVRGRLR